MVVNSIKEGDIVHHKDDPNLIGVITRVISDNSYQVKWNARRTSTIKRDLLCKKS